MSRKYSLSSIHFFNSILRPQISFLSRKPLQSRRAFSVNASNSTASKDDYAAQIQYQHIEDVERIENYTSGGYHPLTIGDELDSRYRVVHKLGHGSYSTIWLARDKQSGRYVAVKVCTANSNPQEVDTLSSLANNRYYGKIPGGTMIPPILDRFNIQGRNGSHNCYVTIPARTSLSGAKNESWNRLFQLDVAKSLAAQLALAVDYVHSQGFVHGDLHLGNVLLKLPHNFDQLSEEKLYEEYGQPESEPVIRFDGKPLPPGVPSHGIIPIWLGEASEDIKLPESRIILTDFGEAFSPTKELKYESHTPLVNRPPEVRFEPTNPLSFPSDIWMLACSIWSIIAQSPLFEGFMATEDDMTCEHVDALGILPPEWWNKWEARHSSFTKDGKPINRKPFRSWDDRFEDSIQQPRKNKGMQLFSSEERDAVSVMLRSMLSFRPEDRPTASQVLESEWMVKWALPEYNSSKN